MNGTHEKQKSGFAPSATVPIGIKKKRSKIKFCECGCGAIVAWNKKKKCWSKYVQGHSTRDMSQETKNKISKFQTGEKYCRETSYFIYKITNVVNDKNYIGLTKNFENRWSQHKRNAFVNKNNHKLSNAFRKYGVDNFSSEIIDSCRSFANAEILEKYYIKFFDTYNKGYNSTLGGTGSKGHIPTKEERQKASDRMKGNTFGKGIKQSEETRAKRSVSMMGCKNRLGMKNSERHNKIISDFLLGNKYGVGRKDTMERKQQKSEYMKHNNPMYNDESRGKLSNKLKGISYDEKFGRVKSLEIKNKIRNANLERVVPEETKRKISLTLKNKSSHLVKVLV